MDRKQFYYSRDGFINEIVGPYMDASLIPIKGNKIYQYDLTNSQLNCIEDSDDIMVVFDDDYISVKNNKGHLIYGNRLGGFGAYLYDHLYDPRRDKDMSNLSEAAKLATDAISGMTSVVNSYYSPTTTLDYAGYSNGGSITDIAISNCTYRVHVKGGKWLPAVKNNSDYAGIYNQPIDAITIKTDTGKKIQYRVHYRRTGKWSAYVSAYGTSKNKYAGKLGQEIDAIQIYLK